MADGLLVAVLAGGQARRFGGGKLAAVCAGKPVARWVLDAVADAGLPAGLIVTGGNDAAEWADGAWTKLHNTNAAEGLSTSIALASRYALDHGYGRLLVVLGDMPLVDSDYLAQLAAAAGPCGTRYPDGRAGVPAVLGRDLLEHAAQLSGDRGAGPLLRGAVLYDAPEGSLADVDTGEDLVRIAAILNSRIAR